MLSLNEENTIDYFHYTFELGSHKLETYRGDVNVCDNPICQCNSINIQFSTGEPDDQHPLIFKVNLDVVNRSVGDSTSGTINRNFALALMDDLSNEDWKVLYSIYASAKLYATESMNPKKVEVPFSADEIESDTSLILLHEILPYVRKILITIDGRQYWVCENYCIRTICSCTEAVLICIPGDPKEQSSKQDSFAFDYKENKWRTFRVGEPQIELNAFINAISEKIDPKDHYKKHHEMLRILYSSYRRRNNIDVAVSNKHAIRKKVGRNDLCFCGSGKKYKKCCMLATD